MIAKTMWIPFASKFYVLFFSFSLHFIPLCDSPISQESFFLILVQPEGIWKWWDYRNITLSLNALGIMFSF